MPSANAPRKIFFCIDSSLMTRFLAISTTRCFRSAPLIPGGALERRRDVALADIQNSLGVDAPIVTGAHDGLVARALALLDEPRADPPDERVKPEHGFHEHLHGSRQVVAAAPVRELVLEHGAELRLG